MRSKHSHAPITPVVLQWRPPTDTPPGTCYEEGDAVLIDGPFFRSWLASLPIQEFDPDTASAGWQALISHVDPRDKYVERTEGPAPRTISQLYWRVAEPILIALVALYCAASMSKLFKPTEAPIAIGALALLGFLASLVRRFRTPGLLWGGSIVTAYAIALLVVLIRHAA